jgi:hypothetical protein
MPPFSLCEDTTTTVAFWHEFHDIWPNKCFLCFVLDPVSSYLILKKTDVENVFRLFQDSEENKKLVYVSIWSWLIWVMLLPLS